MILARGHTYNFEVTLGSDSKFSSQKQLETILLPANMFKELLILEFQTVHLFFCPADAPDVLYCSSSNEQMPGGKFG